MFQRARLAIASDFGTEDWCSSTYCIFPYVLLVFHLFLILSEINTACYFSRIITVCGRWGSSCVSIDLKVFPKQKQANVRVSLFLWIISFKITHQQKKSDGIDSMCNVYAMWKGKGKLCGWGLRLYAKCTEKGHARFLWIRRGVFIGHM